VLLPRATPIRPSDIKIKITWCGHAQAKAPPCLSHATNLSMMLAN